MDGGNMERVLHLMADKGASDVYLTANSPIQLKINGQLVPVSDQILTPGQPRALAQASSCRRGALHAGRGRLLWHALVPAKRPACIHGRCLC